MTSNDSEIIRGTLRIYGSLYLVIFLVFCFARRRYPKLYNLRSWVPELKCSLAQTQSYGFFNWAWRVFRVHDDDLLANCGMDALCFLRCLRLGAKLSAVGCFNAIWLIPVYFTAHGLADTEEDRFILISVANLQPGSSRFSAVVVAAYVMVGSTLWLLSSEYDWYTKYRHKILSQRIPRNYAIYVSGIPEAFRSSYALAGFFQNALEASVAMNIPKLEAKVARRKVIVQRLEHALAEEKQTGVVRTHRTFKLRNATKSLNRVSESVESIQAYRSELNKLNSSISLEIGHITKSNHVLRRHLIRQKADSDIPRGRILTPCDEELWDTVHISSEQPTSAASSNAMYRVDEDVHDGTVVDESPHRSWSSVAPNTHAVDAQSCQMQKGFVALDDKNVSPTHVKGEQRLSSLRTSKNSMASNQFGNALDDDDDDEKNDEKSPCRSFSEVRKDSERRNNDSDADNGQYRPKEASTESILTTVGSKANASGQPPIEELGLIDIEMTEVHADSVSQKFFEYSTGEERTRDLTNLDDPQQDEKDHIHDDNTPWYDEENPTTLLGESQSVAIQNTNDSPMDLWRAEDVAVNENMNIPPESLDDDQKCRSSKAITFLVNDSSCVQVTESDQISANNIEEHSTTFKAPDAPTHHQQTHNDHLRNQALNKPLEKRTTSGSTITNPQYSTKSVGSNSSLWSTSSGITQQDGSTRGSSMRISNASINSMAVGVKSALGYGVNGALSAAGEAKKVAGVGISTLQRAPDRVLSTISQNAAAIAPMLLNNGEGAPRQSGFVVFDNLYSTQAALQMLHHPDGKLNPLDLFAYKICILDFANEPTHWSWVSRTATSMLVENAPTPKEIFWLNVGLPDSARRTGSLLSLGATCTLCVFWSFPVAFISSLTEVNSLKENLPRLADLIEEFPALEMFLALVAPLLLLILNESLLPSILKCFSRWQGYISVSRLEASVFRKLSAFAIIQTFFVSTISGSFTSELANMINNPEDIVDFLANALPAQSSYFIQIVLIFTFLFQGMELLRVQPLGYAFVRRFVGPNLTAKERRRKWKFIYSLENPPAFYHAEVSSQIVLQYVVYFVYAPISPITCVFLLGCFLIMESGYRYHFIHNYPAYPDSGGRIWEGFMLALMFSMLIGQLTLIGLLLLNQAFYSVPALAPLLAVTMLFMITVHPKRIRVSNYLPASECLEVDKQNSLDSQSASVEFLKDQYLQPALTQRELLADDCSD